VSSIT